jgi:hypothetical protein
MTLIVRPSHFETYGERSWYWDIFLDGHAFVLCFREYDDDWDGTIYEAIREPRTDGFTPEMGRRVYSSFTCATPGQLLREFVRDRRLTWPGVERR